MDGLFLLGTLDWMKLDDCSKLRLKLLPCNPSAYSLQALHIGAYQHYLTGGMYFISTQLSSVMLSTASFRIDFIPPYSSTFVSI